MHQFNVFFILPCAKYQSYRFILTLGHIVFLQPAQIQFHLSFVCCLKFSEFQINGNETAQTAVIKQQIDIVILFIDCYTLLSG